MEKGKFKVGDVISYLGLVEQTKYKIIYISNEVVIANSTHNNITSEIHWDIDYVNKYYKKVLNKVKLWQYAYFKDVYNCWFCSGRFYKDDNDFIANNPNYPTFKKLEYSNIEVENK